MCNPGGAADVERPDSASERTDHDMTTTQLSTAATVIHDLVRANKTGTSFVEIAGTLRAAGINPDGDLGIEHPKCHNLFMWVGVNEVVSQALNELLHAELVHYRPTTVLVYMVDGGLLDMPVAQRPPRNGYKDPRWMPVVVDDGPLVEGGVQR